MWIVFITKIYLYVIVCLVYWFTYIIQYIIHRTVHSFLGRAPQRSNRFWPMCAFWGTCRLYIVLVLLYHRNINRTKSIIWQCPKSDRTKSIIWLCPKSDRWSDWCLYDPMSGARTVLSLSPKDGSNTSCSCRNYILLTVADDQMLLLVVHHRFRWKREGASKCRPSHQVVHGGVWCVW
jgi:hypothetical protein